MWSKEKRRRRMIELASWCVSSCYCLALSLSSYHCLIRLALACASEKTGRRQLQSENIDNAPTLALRRVQSLSE